MQTSLNWTELRLLFKAARGPESRMAVLQEGGPAPVDSLLLSASTGQSVTLGEVMTSSGGDHLHLVLLRHFA